MNPISAKPKPLICERRRTLTRRAARKIHHGQFPAAEMSSQAAHCRAIGGCDGLPGSRGCGKGRFGIGVLGFMFRFSCLNAVHLGVSIHLHVSIPLPQCSFSYAHGLSSHARCFSVYAGLLRRGRRRQRLLLLPLPLLDQHDNQFLATPPPPPHHKKELGS